MSKASVEAITKFLVEKGFDLSECNLQDTPARIDRMYDELFSGEGTEPDVKLTTFEGEFNDLIIIRDIPIYSMCSHHFLPFVGVCHIAYLPKGKVLGLSKFPRIVDHYAHKAQIQERLVAEIADYIYLHLKPVGLLVTVQAEHFCVSMRGVKKAGTKMITTALRGDIDKGEVFESLRTFG